ncbi:MAG: 50S ribosomal protein L19 [Bacteroidales bacterium]|nr:50S ribosomal protein L19 [Bacteroidales bacterium]
MDYIKLVEQSFQNEKVAAYPQFKAGDTITVTYKIKEGDKERLQKFRGVVIQIKGQDPFTRTFTIRKVSGGVGVERIFPYESPAIDSIEMNKVGKVRRARIFYLRDLAGKKARIKEKKFVAKEQSAE